ncbi:MAG: O-antigen ligase family protein [Trueperaceae bacterium]
MWEISFLAALIAGLQVSWLFWPLNIALLLYGLQMTLALNLFDLQSYLSGSVHYVAGAQSLLLVPLAVVALVKSRLGWAAAGWCLLAFASLYLALISGARAVYLPLVIVLVLTVVRLIWSGVDRKRLLVATVVLTPMIYGFDYVFPNEPMMTALGKKATVEAQVSASTDQGGFSNRFRLWDQTLGVVLDRPLGAGVGSYQATAHAYQKYPMSWSNSPHNYFLETLATGGWIRLALLLGLLVPPLFRTWFSREWPWALAVGGIWMTLAFDVTSYYPSFMMLAFLALGVLYAKAPVSKVSEKFRAWQTAVPRVLSVATVVVGATMTAWWFLPCTSNSCAVDRYLGIDYKVLPALEQADPQERRAMLDRVRELYPASSWVVRAEQRYAETPERRLALAREFATRFPLQHPQNYLDWSRAALELGQQAEAIQAIRTGLEVFPADRYPYGEQRMTRERYGQWIDDAEGIIATASQESP